MTNSGASQNSRPTATSGARQPEAITTLDLRQDERIQKDRRVLRLARYPEGEPGVSLEYLYQQTSRSTIKSVWESVIMLTALGYLEEVTLSDGSTGYALTELAVEKEGFLPADEITLVRLPGEAIAMRPDQLLTLSDLPQNIAKAKLSSLVNRGFLTEQKDSVEGLIICPTRMGLAEAGFNRAHYVIHPAGRGLGHVLGVSDVRIALVDEFVPRDDEGNREWGSWQWLSERMRGRVVSRLDKHMPDGFFVNGREFSLAVEVALSKPENDQLDVTMLELSRDHSEVRYYADNDESRKKITRARKKLKLRNVKLLDMPERPSSSPSAPTLSA